jgi:aminoglycoside/choline kinase family phosphotransferase
MSRTNIHPGIVDDIDELRPDWLTAAMQHDGLDVVVTDAVIDQVFSDGQQRLVRLDLTYAASSRGPSSVIAKLASSDPASRWRMIPSAQAEVRFYRELVSTVAVRTPRCLFATDPDDRGGFTLLFEDLAPATFGDQLAGCLPDQLRSAVSNLGALHGPRWCDPSLGRLGWLDSTVPDVGDRFTALFRAARAEFWNRFGDRMEVDDLRLLRQIGDDIAIWATGRPERFSILHGDYHLGRLAFDPSWGDDDEPAVSVVDWRAATIGLPTRDLAFLLATAQPAEDRQDNERDLVDHYHQALIGHGVRNYTPEQCWDDYRYSALQGPLSTVLCGALAPRSDYCDEVSLLMISRTLDAVRDLASLELT